MKLPGLCRYFTIIILSLVTNFAAADSDKEKQHQPVNTMAMILVDLNHYPETKEKEKLQAIANSTENSTAIQTIAMAIHDMEHSVTPEDKAKLKAIIENENASSTEKELAEILLGITHYPNSEAKAKLEELAK